VIVGAVSATGSPPMKIWVNTLLALLAGAPADVLVTFRVRIDPATVPLQLAQNRNVFPEHPELAKFCAPAELAAAAINDAAATMVEPLNRMVFSPGGGTGAGAQ
jgi:hypothetical protein